MIQTRIEMDKFGFRPTIMQSSSLESKQGCVQITAFSGYQVFVFGVSLYTFFFTLNKAAIKNLCVNYGRNNNNSSEPWIIHS